ncbi:MAG: hypothetical protein QW607_03685 [Desulfurococcaceae archaeon]
MNIRKILSSSNIVKKIFKKKRKIKGFLDGIDGQYVFGWVWDRENPEERLEVIIYVDGKPIATGVADIYRQDLEKAGIGDGRHGFRIKLGTNIFDGNEHELSVKVINDNSLVEKPTLSKIFRLSNINDFKILSEDFFGLKYQETLNILEQIKSEKENIAEENKLLLEQLHQAQEELEKYYIKYQDTLTELEKEKAERERVITEREGRIRELEAERDELNKALTELRGEFEKLHREKEEAVKAYEARILGQEKERTLLLQKIEQLEAEIKEKSETINKLTGEVEQLKGALLEAEKEKAERERVITEREGRIRELEAQIHQLNQALAEANKKLNDILNLNNQLEKEKSNLESILSEKNQKIQQLEGELIELQKRQEILDEELIKLEAQIEIIKDVLLKEAKS